MKYTGAYLISLSAVAALMAACGESSSASSGGDGSSSASNKPAEYATLDDAGACAPSRYGETVFVTAEGELYFCSGKKWVLIDDEDGDSFDGKKGGNSSAQGKSSSSRSGDSAPHKPDILQWGASLTKVTIRDTVKFTLTYLTDANGFDDIKHYDWDFGDGMVLHKTDSSFTRHAYADVGNYVVSIKVTDSNGDTAKKSLNVVVTNPPPVVDAGLAMTCYNATPCEFMGTAYDRNDGAPVGSIKLYEWDFDGDGVTDASSLSGSFAHAYPDTAENAHYTARFCATDDDDNRVCDTTSVSVSNRAPTLRGTIAMKVSGTAIVFRSSSLEIEDPEGNQRDSLWWDLDNDGVFEVASRWTDSVTKDVSLTAQTVKVRGKDKWGRTSNAISGRTPDVYVISELFDYSQGNPGVGTMIADGTHIRTYEGDAVDTASASVEIEGVTSLSFKASVKLKKFIYETQWGYVNGGLVYVLDGTSFVNASAYDIGDSISITVKAQAGKSWSIYGIDKFSYNIDCLEGLPNMRQVGTGSWQTVTIPVSSIRPFAGASNALDPSHVYAIGVEYEYLASMRGGPCSLCSDMPMDLEWQSLRISRRVPHLGE